MRKNVFTINPETSFIDRLSEVLLKRTEGKPEALAAYTILLPNRRSCRNLASAFAKNANNKALILPKIRAIGDTDESELILSDISGFDEIKPAISEIKRTFLLAEIIRERENIYGKVNYEDSLNLARELEKFLDEMQRHELPLDNLSNDIDFELTEHWQKTLDFLSILSLEWPEILEREGCLDIIDRRNKLIRLQSKIWQLSPPDSPVIAAGSIGSLPATLDLLKTIAGLPKGEVILPMVDKNIDEMQLNYIASSHPQYLVKNFCESICVKLSDIEEWGDKNKVPINESGRAHFVREIMRPAQTVSSWVGINLSEESIANLSMIEFSNLSEESQIISLMLRNHLNDHGRKAALVTNNRDLAIGVSSILKKWNVNVDDSSGMPISKIPLANFFLNIAEMVTSGFSAVKFLSVMKNSLCSFGFEKNVFRKLISDIELYVFREALIKDVFSDEANVALNEAGCSEALELLAAFKSIINEFSDLILGNRKIYLSEVIKLHLQVLEKLNGNNNTDYKSIWESDDSSSELLEYFTKIIGSTNKELIDPVDYLPTIKNFLATKQYWPPDYSRTKISILSPMEARLGNFDLLILADLNAGSWPKKIGTGWINKAMREKFGLPDEEIAMGHAAHDFTSFLFAPEIIMTRAKKVNGSPSAASSWWIRMETVLKSANKFDRVKSKIPWIEWYKILQQADYKPCARPEPRPPVFCRPRVLSVTQIGKLMQDPYSIYASQILKFRKLNEIDKLPDQAEFGNIVHKIFEVFCGSEFAYSDDYNKTFEQILKIAEDIFYKKKISNNVYPLWMARFKKLAAWFCEEQVKRSENISALFSEQNGAISWISEAGNFTLKARADRLEISKDGVINIIDYKTGSIPMPKDIYTGIAPQLLLEALIAMKGGFTKISIKTGDKIDADSIGMEYWQLNPSKDSMEIKCLKNSLVENTEDNIKSLINKFDREETSYIACPNPKTSPNYNDFAHLERLKEYQ